MATPKSKLTEKPRRVSAHACTEEIFPVTRADYNERRGSANGVDAPNLKAILGDDGIGIDPLLDDD